MTNKGQSSEEVDLEAVAWAVKVDADSMSPEDNANLDIWLRADTRHVGAFAKARAILIPDAGNTVQLAWSSDAPRPLKTTRRRWLAAGVAVIVSLVGVTGTAVWKLSGDQTYATHIGETRVIPLGDGSVITLNTNSIVSVHYTKYQRGIKLLQGEALFDVSKDRARPFLVTAGLTVVQAVGTSFVVKLLPDQPVQVLVREGVVEVKRPDVPVAAPVRVATDMRAVAPIDAPIATANVSSDEITRSLAWRAGRIAFHGEALKDAAAEFARYSDTRIQITDPNIANQTVTGLFVSNDPVGFAKGVAFSLNLRVEVEENEVRLTR